MFIPNEIPITHFGQEILRGAASFSWNANFDLLVDVQSARVL